MVGGEAVAAKDIIGTGLTIRASFRSHKPFTSVQMNQQRWRRLKEIVADALEEDSPAARTALLTRECADDLYLLREAESFLADADMLSGEETDQLEECAAVTAAAVRRERIFTAGHRVGAYVIIRELGHGGMATVYLAARADGYFEKEVAIKVLKLGGGSTVELIGRFRAEREVLASLDHTNIAALFDAGTTEKGMPYFVMEYVSGTPITTYVREKNLSVRQRLALFLKICAAVEVAHRKRIVHRDLKRGNILVNEDGEPKLLDFGISKLLEENPLTVTATGQQRLTPISASPEQARGEPVTTASDIYALGALLYEILTGQTPHRFPSSRPGLQEVEKVVCEQDPILPSLAVKDSEIQRALRGDLDAIILRAMRKDPSERYASVGDLEQDIRRYLAGEPVHARRNTLPYRLARFAGRHQPSAGRIALTAATITAAVGVTLFLLNRHPRQVTATSPVRAPAEVSSKSIAVLPFDDFGAAEGNSYFADGVQDDILTDLARAQDLRVTSRSGAAAYRKGVRDVREIRQALGVAYVLEGSVRRSTDRVRVNVQLIDTNSDVQVWAEQYDRKLGDLFALQSDLSQAIVTQLKGKLSTHEKAAIESRPTSDIQAYDFYLRAREAFVNYQYEKTIELLNNAIARDPKFALAYCLLTDAQLYVYRFGEDHSAERLEKARVAAETALRLAPNLPESHLAKAQYYYNGLRDYEKAQAELAVAPPSPAGRARFFDLTALTERRLGHWKEAVRDGEKAWELDPHDPFIATEVIQSYMALRRYPEAEKLADKALKLISTRVAPFWSLKADALLAEGDLARVGKLFESAPPDISNNHAELARIALYKRDFVTAGREIEMARKGEMPLPWQYLDLLEGTIARVEGDVEGAARAFDKARVSLEAVLAKHSEEPALLANLAWAYAGLARKDDALRTIQQAVHLIPSWRDAMEGPAYASMQAQIQAWVGNKDAAIEQLRSVVKQPGGPSYGELKLDPGWDDLRADPRFEQLIAEAKQPIPID
jgi:eukaryotic-like serine/threonine-protein kinase